VKSVLKVALKKWNPGLSKVLDLACGSGEITSMLMELGYQNVDACDPYT
jgi:2-polyprenyl-3-methyl-5-hydroxy-6-metoxy-1,4-benzoquinol methylase